MGKVIIICGATATGKTALAAECAVRLGTEIISADSQLIYRGMDIGTAKPTADEMRGVKHHMIDVVSPLEKYSVFDYESAAKPIMERLLAEGKNPIICGGTGFYINSLIFDLNYGGTAADENIRKKYQNILEERGREYLFSLLSEVDPQTAQKLHPNDTKRVIRALEIYELSGVKKSEQNDKYVSKYNYVAIRIVYPRELLYNRINERVDKMFGRGLVDEVKALVAAGVDENCQSMQAIGYKEVLQCLKNGDNESTMRNIIKQNSRRYAKRQITFFKKFPNIISLDYNNANYNSVAELIDD